ncbi:hypothetical protein ACR1PO_13785 [Chryseobacterium sp. RRHN12]|uniref:hypothetical protein n=1 Tax=Chryseobacterium sp. RRHN12 TaxID=3437884 RepID=UPI003D9B7D88
MNLPKVITELVRAQNNFDSAAYAECFTETAVVFDEGKIHNGKTEIEKWIDKSNKEYKARWSRWIISKKKISYQRKFQDHFRAIRSF